MANAFRIGWLVFAFALIASIAAYAAWPGGDVQIVDSLGNLRTQSPLRYFFALPLACLVIMGIAYAAVRAKPQARETLFREVVLVGSVASWFAVHLVFIALAFGYTLDVMKLAGALGGLLIVAADNYLPKSARDDSIGLPRPWNYFFSIPWNLPLAYLFGVRTWWTLKTDQVWNRTHRLAGRLWILGGLAYIVLPWVIEGRPLLAALLSAWTLMVVVPVLYSLFLSMRGGQGAHA